MCTVWRRVHTSNICVINLLSYSFISTRTYSYVHHTCEYNQLQNRSNHFDTPCIKKTLVANIIWGPWYRNEFVLITDKMAITEPNRYTRKEPVPESSRTHLARGRRLTAWTMAQLPTAFFRCSLYLHVYPVNLFKGTCITFSIT